MRDNFWRGMRSTNALVAGIRSSESSRRTPIRVPLALAALLLASAPGRAPLAEAATGDAGTRLLKQPAVSEGSVAFTHAGDLWTAGRDGGRAHRLTATAARVSDPHFSPDGEWLAFTARYEGNPDVYIVPAAGGEPRRLTWHPGRDEVEGWTPNGGAVLFASSRRSPASDHRRFFTVDRAGGLPEPLAVPRAHQGALSPDGTRIAYQQVDEGDRQWRGYRGGKARPVWLFDRDRQSLQKLPREGRSRQLEPVWLGEVVYFLSDRTGVLNVWAYDTRDGELRQLTDHREFDVVSLDAGAGAIVYERGGWIHRLDPASGRSSRLEIRVTGDFPRARPRWAEVGERIANAALSPDGKRALLEARGEMLTVSAADGEWRNLTRSSASAERQPAWSPNGEKLAWFSDAGGEYALMVADVQAPRDPRRLEIEEPSFFYELQWSPDSRHLLFTDADRRLWYLDTKTGEQVYVDRDPHTAHQRTLDPAWSPDGEWIAYARRGDNRHRAIRLYSLEAGTSYPVTRGLADAISPAWDPGGEYLYFAASTDYSVHSGWLDMATFHRPLTRGLYAAILPADGVPPGGAGEDAADGGEPAVRVDPEGLSRRIVALERAKKRYDRLRTGAAPGVLYYLERESAYSPIVERPGKLHRYDLRSGEATRLLDGVDRYALAADGKRLVYHAGDTWGVVASEGQAEAGDGALPTESLRVHVDPQREWQQIFEEAWRIKRDYFYVENMHGADWKAVREKYRPWLAHVRSRYDLNTVLDYMSGELAVSHVGEGGGDMPQIDEVAVGVLGADLEAVEGGYRVRRIYSGAPWTPDVRAPLAVPGLDVDEGDYLVAVNGEALGPSDNPYRALAGTAGREITLRVNDRPRREGSRQVAVTPLETDRDLRLWSWVEANRQRVDRLSDGRLAYVHVPNTARKGYRFFNRLYFSQQDRAGVIVDGRYNNGGFSPGYITEVLARPLLGFNSNPAAPDTPRTEPGSGLWGPTVMVTNEEAGSGGDFLPYFFKQREIGPLVGRRTMGAEVGAYDYPGFVDGGGASVPRSGFYDREGEWAIENEGVAPDIRVEQTPRAIIDGGDPQLERAVEEALRLLKEKEWPRIQPQPPAPEPARALRQ